MHHHGYAVVQRETVSARGLERELLQRITMRLKSADTSTTEGLAMLLEALRMNRSLWLTFAADLASPTNRCSDQVKASMISIAGYVERNSFAASRSGEVLQSFIDINDSVARGLEDAPASFEQAVA